VLLQKKAAACNAVEQGAESPTRRLGGCPAGPDRWCERHWCHPQTGRAFNERPV